MNLSGPVVIVGASHAGLAAAAELRAAGFAGQIDLVGAEPSAPYHRPHLSKESLAADLPAPKPIRPAAYFDDNRIALHHASVTAIDRAAQLLLLAGGEVLPYGRLILAPGAEARRLGPDIDPLRRAFSLREKADWQEFGPAFDAARTLAVIGGGLIGLEVAAAARARGKAVTVIEAAPALMGRCLSPELAGLVQARHEDAGIAFRLGASVTGIDDKAIHLRNGEVIGADLFLAAIGSRPRCGLAEAAGLACADGIAVDAGGRTSDPDIFALGDCARWHDGEALRHESVAATQAQARSVAAALMGLPAPAPHPLRLWSTQGALRLQFTGPVPANATTEITAPAEDARLLRAFLDGRLVAVQALNAPRPFNAAVAEISAAQSGQVDA